MNNLNIVVLIFALSLSQLAFAEWTYGEAPLGPGYNVTDGEQTIHVNLEKTAKKMTKVLNKNEKKQDSFIDNGDCPKGVLC